MKSVIKQVGRGSVYIPTPMREKVGIEEECIVEVDDQRELIIVRKK